MAERGHMADRKNKGSVSKTVQAISDAPANDGVSKMQAAAEALVKIIIEGGDSVRRAG